MSEWNSFFIIIGLLISLGIYLVVQNKWIQVKHFHIKLPSSGKGLKGKKIVQLSDLHLPRQGVSMLQLVKKVALEKPDVIVLTGDVVDVRGNLPETKLQNLAQSLISIAPTYAVTGNHDANGGYLQEWEDILTTAGVRVLIDEAEWIEFEEDGFVLMGLSEKEDFDRAPRPILRGISLTEGMQQQPKILLAHHPELFEDYLMDLTKAPDLILSGHAHGGQIRLPFVGGLFSPGQGKWPKYTDGVYYDSEMPGNRMIVSRGIGNSTFPFRFNNRPEVVIVTLD
ncbi:metallophosphoesterase [Carnobacterium funditum]|uniref:metallophosphoesterase n=1 Tax=Carnobacterium funditum TaxID=2752 RepID=UPI0005596D3E|nr:metallophosphoesterase [Carnobacterium funditum]